MDDRSSLPPSDPRTLSTGRAIVWTSAVPYRLCGSNATPEQVRLAMRDYGWRCDATTAAEHLATVRSWRDVADRGNYPVAKRRGYWFARIEVPLP